MKLTQVIQINGRWCHPGYILVKITFWTFHVLIRVAPDLKENKCLSQICNFANLYQKRQCVCWILSALKFTWQMSWLLQKNLFAWKFFHSDSPLVSRPVLASPDIRYWPSLLVRQAQCPRSHCHCKDTTRQVISKHTPDAVRCLQPTSIEI